MIWNGIQFTYSYIARTCSWDKRFWLLARKVSIGEFGFWELRECKASVGKKKICERGVEDGWLVLAYRHGMVGYGMEKSGLWW